MAKLRNNDPHHTHLGNPSTLERTNHHQTLTQGTESDVLTLLITAPRLWQCISLSLQRLKTLTWILDLPRCCQGAVQAMVSEPIVALRGHKRETGATGAVLWSPCPPAALLALWDLFWFGWRNDAVPYSFPWGVCFIFPCNQLSFNELALKLNNCH